ncbi:hypothetical protein LXL04_034447 [Taraxacum kok-saghyz]
MWSDSHVPVFGDSVGSSVTARCARGGILLLLLDDELANVVEVLDDNRLNSVHSNSYEWNHHTFSAATISVIKSLGHAHMSKALRSAQISTYLVVAADRLRNVGRSLIELEIIRVEQDGLKERLFLLEMVKRSFEEKMNRLVGEKSLNRW